MGAGFKIIWWSPFIVETFVSIMYVRLFALNGSFIVTQWIYNFDLDNSGFGFIVYFVVGGYMFKM